MFKKSIHYPIIFISFILFNAIIFIAIKNANASDSVVGNSLSKKIIEDALHRRLQYDLDSVTEELNAGHFPQTVTIPLRTELTAIARQIPLVTVDNVDTFTTIFPINDLHRRIFALQAGIWRSMGFNNIVAWPDNRWDMLSPTAPPIKGHADVDVSLMQNEFRSAVFNLSNPRDTVTNIKFTIEGLPGGINPEYITVHEVPFTDTKSGVPVAAALPLLQREASFYVLKISSGLTCQIWLTFHPTHTQAGEYNGRIVLHDESVNNLTIPVRLKIYPLRFPDKPTLHLSGWDYTDHESNYWSVTPNNRETLIKLLREYFVDSPWASNAVLSLGQYDSKGRMTQSPDPTEFRRWINRWPHAYNYYIAICFGHAFYGFSMGTPAFQQAVADWINWWVNQLKQWGVQPNQLGLLLLDEPHSPEEDNTIIQYAKAIHAAQPNVVVWEDPTWGNPYKAEQELFKVSQVLSPNLTMWIKHGNAFKDFYLKQGQMGKQLWFYSCLGPARLLDPYSYYRLQAWFAWKYGAKGESFWAFSDSGDSSSWNEYTVSAHGAFTPLFIDAKSVMTGKHMEAIREGIEDYEYLRMLRDKINELKKKGMYVEKVQSAQKLLNSAIERVIGNLSVSSEHWKNSKDRTIADQVRIRILGILTQLNLL